MTRVLSSLLAITLLLLASPIYAGPSDSAKDLLFAKETEYLFKTDKTYSKLEEISSQIATEFQTMLNENTSSQPRLNQQLDHISHLLSEMQLQIRSLEKLKITSPELIKFKKQTIEFYESYCQIFKNIVSAIKSKDTTNVHASTNDVKKLERQRVAYMKSIHILASKLNSLTEKYRTKSIDNDKATEYYQHEHYDKVIRAFTE